MATRPRSGNNDASNQTINVLFFVCGLVSSFCCCFWHLFIVDWIARVTSIPIWQQPPQHPMSWSCGAENSPLFTSPMVVRSGCRCCQSTQFRQAILHHILRWPFSTHSLDPFLMPLKCASFLGRAAIALRCELLMRSPGAPKQNAQTKAKISDGTEKLVRTP